MKTKTTAKELETMTDGSGKKTFPINKGWTKIQ